MAPLVSGQLPPSDLVSGSVEEATAQLEELCASKLMLHLADGRFLALAVAGEMPSLLKIREFPGGACQVPAAIS